MQDLSAEFERFRQQNTDLARVYSSLCLLEEKQSAWHDVCPEKPRPPIARNSGMHRVTAPPQKGAQNDAQRDAGTNKLRPPGSPEIKAVSPKAPSPRSSLVSGEPASQWKIQTSRGSAPSYSPQLRRSRSTRSVVVPKTLYEQFRHLDRDDVGRLVLDDVKRIFATAGEYGDYDDMKNLIRLANDLPPLNGNSVRVEGNQNLEDEGSETEELGIDYQAFELIMEGQMLTPEDPAIEQCLESFRRACTPRKGKTQARVVPPPPRRMSSYQKVHNVAAFWLETLPTCVILLNAVVTGLSADHPDKDTVWDIFEYIFVSFYTCECIAKIYLYGFRNYFCGKERMWNVFDFTCLILSLADTSVKLAVEIFMKGKSALDTGAVLMIKIFRLARLARLVRTLRFKIFYELKLMVMGVYSGLRVLTWAIILLIMLIYVFGVAMTNLFGANEPEFSSVYASMFSLFRCWTDDCAAYDGTPLSERLRANYGEAYMVYHILSTMFVTVGLFNLFMAIFMDNVMTTQLVRKHKDMAEKTPEIEKRFKLLFHGFIKHGLETNKNMRATVVGRVWSEINGASNGTNRRSSVDSNVDEEWEKLLEMEMTITRDVFRAWLHDPEFLQLLEEADIETTNHFELFDVLDADNSGELSMAELLTGLMKLRGPVTKADIVAVRLKMGELMPLLETLLPPQESSDEGS